jgi:DUF1680 family protein
VDVKNGTEAGYLSIRRTWRKGDRIALELPMSPERIYAHPAVKEDIGRVALKRGPLVYCAEQADNTVAVPRLRLPREAAIATETRTDLFDGIATLVVQGAAVNDAWRDDLYRTSPPRSEPATWTAVPYYLWNNRAAGAMAVWIPEN